MSGQFSSEKSNADSTKPINVSVVTPASFSFATAEKSRHIFETRLSGGALEKPDAADEKIAALVTVNSPSCAGPPPARPCLAIAALRPAI